MFQPSISFIAVIFLVIFLEMWRVFLSWVRLSFNVWKTKNLIGGQKYVVVMTILKHVNNLVPSILLSNYFLLYIFYSKKDIKIKVSEVERYLDFQMMLYFQEIEKKIVFHLLYPNYKRNWTYL